MALFLLNQAIAQYEITKHAISNGGGTSKNLNDDVSITGSIGQLDASAPLSGGGYKLSGGFWTDGTRPEELFKDGFE
jgi:hypothetical protein